MALLAEGWAAQTPPYPVGEELPTVAAACNGRGDLPAAKWPGKERVQRLPSRAEPPLLLSIPLLPRPDQPPPPLPAGGSCPSAAPAGAGSAAAPPPSGPLPAGAGAPGSAPFPGWLCAASGAGRPLWGSRGQVWGCPEVKRHHENKTGMMGRSTGSQPGDRRFCIERGVAAPGLCESAPHPNPEGKSGYGLSMTFCPTNVHFRQCGNGTEPT